MAARSVQVFLHNETDRPLSRLGTDVEHGEWGTSPPERIAPFSIATMSSTSDSFLTGTEARATYRIGDEADETIYVHWDNPFSGSNSYHTNTDATHYSMKQCFRES